MKFIIYSLSHEPEVFEVKVQRGANKHKDHEREHEILLDTPRLYTAQIATEPPCDFIRPISHSLVHDKQINVFADK